MLICNYWILISPQNIFPHRRVIVLSSFIMPDEKIYSQSSNALWCFRLVCVGALLHSDNRFENRKKTRHY